MKPLTRNIAIHYILDKDQNRIRTLFTTPPHQQEIKTLDDDNKQVLILATNVVHDQQTRTWARIQTGIPLIRH